MAPQYKSKNLPKKISPKFHIGATIQNTTQISKKQKQTQRFRMAPENRTSIASITPFIKRESNLLIPPTNTFISSSSIKMERSRELDNYSRKQIMHELLLFVNNKGKPTHGIIGEISKKYKVSRKTISRMWG